MTPHGSEIGAAVMLAATTVTLAMVALRPSSCARQSRAILPSVLLVAMLGGVLFFGGCMDSRQGEMITDPSLGIKGDCPPGQAKKGLCVDPPDPGHEPVEPSFQGGPPIGGLISPVRLAATPAGRLLVTDARHRMLLRIDPGTLEADQSLRLRGRPSGVALMGGRTFVGNKTSGTVDVYESDGGSFLVSFRAPSLREPSDLAVDLSQGLVFVSDVQAGQILVFDTVGTLRQTISSKGLGEEQLFAPMGVATDMASERVLVSDWGDFGGSSGGTARVKVFGYDGTFIGSISGAGNCGMLGCSGGFSRPGGLAFSGDNVFVPDLLLGEVLVYELTSFTPVGTIGGRPQLRLPADVEVLGDTDLLVVSNGTASVEAFPGGAQ